MNNYDYLPKEIFDVFLNEDKEFVLYLNDYLVWLESAMLKNKNNILVLEDLRQIYLLTSEQLINKKQEISSNYGIIL